MKDYHSLSDFEINCKAANFINKSREFIDDVHCGKWDPCNNIADAWPIIVKNGISIVTDSGVLWHADADAYWVDGVEWQINGEWHKNPLRAAMIVFLKMQEDKC